MRAVDKKIEDKKFVTLACVVKNQHGKAVAKGDAQVMAPTEKLEVEAPSLPNITVG